MAEATGFTAEKIQEMIGDVIVGVRVISGQQLIFKTKSGREIDAGNVLGFPETKPTAATLPSTATGVITATNVQSALTDAATRLNSLNTTKAARTSVKKIISGTVRHRGGTYESDGFVVHEYEDFNNIFPAGFFATVPEVVVTPIKSSLITRILSGWSVVSVTTRSFRLWAGAFSDDVMGEPPRPLPIDYNYIATSSESLT